MMSCRGYGVCILLLSLTPLALTQTLLRDPGEYEVDVSPVQSSSQCFHIKGVPTFRLRCPSHHLIKVHQAFYGVPPQNQTCRYSDHEQHCVQMTDLRENCMGRSLCTIYVSNPFLINCHMYATYKQVNYTCIPLRRVQDICATSTLTTHRGFIRSPNYPRRNYTSGLHCACRLQTADRGILLQMLDFSLSHTSSGLCQSDFLKISGWGKKCGTIGPQRLPEKLKLDTSDLTLQFRSDARKHSRGFWLEYTGTNGGEVSVTCGSIHAEEPSDKVEEYRSNSIAINAPADDTKPYDYKNVIIDDSDIYPPSSKQPKESSRENEIDKAENMFKTYDFAESQEFFQYNVNEVQIVTGCVVGGLILIAVIIIIVLVFRR